MKIREGIDGGAITFELTDLEAKRARAFIRKHDPKHIAKGEKLRESGAIGGSWTYRLTLTSLGTVVVVSCSCGESLDVTEYESW